MSVFKTTLVVQKRVSISLEDDSSLINMGTVFGFDLKLSNRGTDFHVFATSGYTENTADSDLLVAIMNRFMTPRSGIEKVQVTGFSIKVWYNKTVTTDSVIERILDAAAWAGYKADYANNDYLQHLR